MSPNDRIVIACSCEGTMPLDAGTLACHCGGELRTADQLCRRELDRFKAQLAEGRLVTVGCTQEAPLFGEVAAELDASEHVAFVNVRETGGWSAEAGAAGPKMAALFAAAAEPVRPPAAVTMTSAGVALVYGRDETAIEAGRRLAEHLDVTVLLTRPGDVTPPRATEFPVLKGTVVAAKGHLGRFELRIDDYALPAPSSRGSLAFGAPRDGATSTCDIVVDLSGGAPLVPAHELRSGYLRADPRDPAAVERAIGAASHLVGEFETPRFIDVHERLCAHSRSRITGCTRCLELCPTGAITPAGNHVSIDPHVCAGCGSCASACPTGAAAYALPSAEGLVRRLRQLVRTYREAGGERCVVLFHDAQHGGPLIDALARTGDGLPSHVVPFAVNEVSQVGPEALAAIFAYGASGAAVLARRRPLHDLVALERAMSLANTVLTAHGYGDRPVSLLEVDDPDELGASLHALRLGTATERPASFLVSSAKRGLLELAFRELRQAAPAPADLVPLAAGAPFGGLDFDIDSCTLCLACVGACPTAALTDNPDRPQLSFKEDLCVQCGLCANTCPEDVITLRPQIDYAAWDAPKRVVKEEEPFHCTVCAKPFGTRSAIERVVAKLQDRHWMFAGPSGHDRARIITMCEDCRVGAVLEQNFDPHAVERPAPRTTADYLRERAERSV